MTFIQLIEYRTSQPEQLDKMMDEWMAATEGQRTVTRAVVASDHDKPGTYMEIVEFPSYDEAMRNSEMPETGEFAARMAALCDGEPIFRNLDVQREEKL
ncbi:hypothetical protein FKR81_14905 [Lentzea tibetensis]|uniref:ABM domain-containing protein n=1 Tax=Lentzea tibetensis TaxID=2591470 RepID=A0A563EV12_9PSEU|nr:hypothetical protein [Lentzea tibetensis]TWP51493.1 hypothetical protein FKR81_14905 [Lentzea tibetensis]